jgi:hypothetical protein
LLAEATKPEVQICHTRTIAIAERSNHCNQVKHDGKTMAKPTTAIPWQRCDAAAESELLENVGNEPAGNGSNDLPTIPPQRLGQDPNEAHPQVEDE